VVFCYLKRPHELNEALIEVLRKMYFLWYDEMDSSISAPSTAPPPVALEGLFPPTLVRCIRFFGEHAAVDASSIFFVLSHGVLL